MSKSRPKFQTTELSTRIRKTGVITLDHLRKTFHIPETADVYVKVPYGADYSGCNLDVTEIYVTWEELK